MARTYAAELATVVEALSNLTKQADADRAERREYEDDARKHREQLHLQVHLLTEQLKHANERLEKVEPVVSMVTSLHSKVTGGILVLGVIGGIAWGGLVFFKEQLFRMWGG